MTTECRRIILGIANCQPRASADWAAISIAPRDRLILSYCPAALPSQIWPTAPYIVVRWHIDTEAWRDSEGIEVHPTEWLPLDELITEPPMFAVSALALINVLKRPYPSAPGAMIMTTSESIRLDCLKFATECADNPNTVLDAARRFERFVTGSTATYAVRADEIEGADEIDIENDGAVTSMLPDN